MTTIEESVQEWLMFAVAYKALQSDLETMAVTMRKIQQRLAESGMRLPLEAEYHRTGERYRIDHGTSFHCGGPLPTWKAEKVG